MVQEYHGAAETGSCPALEPDSFGGAPFAFP